MTSSAIWQMAAGLVVVIIMFSLAVGARRTVSIGALLVAIPFQTIDTRYASSSILIAYVLASALLMGQGLKLRMMPALGLIVLAYFVSLSLADRSILIYHVIFLFQFFSCLVVFILAYNFALLVERERAVTDVLFAINILVIIYCALQLSVGPGERFVPFGIEQFMFNLNRDPSDPRLVGPFDNPGTTAGYFALMTLICAFEIMFSVGWRRLFVWMITGFNLLGLVATGNRAGFLVLLAMAAVLLFVYRKELGMRRVLTLSIGGAAVLAIAATIAVTYTDFNQLFNRMETVTETEGGIPATRAEGWPVAIEKIKRHPWFGEGPYFWTAEDAERIGQSQAEFVPGGALDTAFDHYPHSLYLYLLRTVGAFGLLAVVGYFVRTWFVLYRVTRQGLTLGYQSAFLRLGLILIPTFLISQITLEFHRPNTMDYAQFIFALMGLLIGMSEHAAFPPATKGANQECHGMHKAATDWLDPRTTKVLLLLLALALLIRLCGINYGLPFVYWIDEYHEVMRAMALGAGDFNLTRTGKGGFYFLLFFEYGVYYVVLKLTGAISTTRDFAEHFVRDPTAFYLTGRATAALFGSATVAAAFYLGRQAYRASAGLFAALFLAVNVLHVGISHRVGVDVPMTLFAALALYFGLNVATDGKRRDYLLAGLCAALATTTKLPGVLVFLPLLIAHIYRVAGTPGGWMRWLTSRDFWLAVAIFVLVLAVTNPGILLHFDYFSFYSTPPDEILDDDAMAAASLASFERPNLYLFYLNVLQDSMGWPLFALATFSLGYSLWKRRPADVMLLSYAAINYFVIAGTSSDVLYYPRYALPIIVVLMILAGRALSDLNALIPRWRAVTSTVVVAALIVWPLDEAVNDSISLTRTDTRTLARDWFDSHVPAGSRVLIEGGKIAASRLTVPLDDSRQSLERRIAYWRVKEPRQAKFLELKHAVYVNGGYELELVQVAAIAPFDDYVAHGIEYFVVRPETFTASRKAESGSARLLSRLRSDTRVKLLKQFKADADRRPGPTIDIYQFRSAMPPTG